VTDLRRHGFHAGFSIPEEIVAALVEHAERRSCSRAAGDAEKFWIRQVINARSPAGKVVAVAEIESEPSRTAWQLAGDASLVEVAHAYLGYRPTRVAQRLYWSPRADLSDDERRWNGQTIDFHYDIEVGPTLYVYFYLSDADLKSGAHVVVAGSHRVKPARLRWGSTRQRDSTILSVYGPDKIVVLEGLKGFGFLEDPACFHKMLPPVGADRLMLQLRYS
jgi:hypothetical protein